MTSPVHKNQAFELSLMSPKTIGDSTPQHPYCSEINSENSHNNMWKSNRSAKTNPNKRRNTYLIHPVGVENQRWRQVHLHGDAVAFRPG